MNNSRTKIAIIGAGVAGTTAAIYLGKLGLDVTLFEKNRSIISGPPFCHLHAGGNLYREISDQACIQLLKESIELLRMYPQAIDYRPTVLAVPKTDSQEPQDLYRRLEILKKEYDKLIQNDIKNKVLCNSENYYKIYTKEDIELLKEKNIIKQPITLDDWMIPVAKNVDLNKLKFPLIMVQEYGLNIFRLGASATYTLQKIKNTNILLNTKVTNIQKNDNEENYNIEYIQQDKTIKEDFDYIINAAGFKTGKIDDMLGFKSKKLVEFKSAYISHWDKGKDLWPEVIFFGSRGTPQGMGQLTPYPNGYFQIHGMTEDITLFQDGLAKSSQQSSHPKLNETFINMIDKGWNKKDIDNRTNKAIKHIEQYIPNFQDATVASKPLFGAQQIPGDEISLRTADVCFEDKKYARCEIVKASSVLTMSDKIIQELINLSYLNKNTYKQRDILFNETLDTNDITKLAQEICKQRDYPISLAEVNIAEPKCRKNI